MADLEKAIKTARQAVEATSEDHPDRAAMLSNLGIRLGDRYSRTGSITDLEEAIKTARQAVEATPEDHPNRAGRLNNLGIRLGNRYSRTGSITDLEEAIKTARQAVEATPEDHPNRAGRLNNLGIRLGDRYSRTGLMTDLEEANKTARQAVEATPEDHPDRAGQLNNLGIRLGDRYSRTGSMTDLEEAIKTARQAVEATSEDHPDRARRLNNLGIRLGDRYSRTGAMTDLEEAKMCHYSVLNHQSSSISTRITSGRQFLFLPDVLRDVNRAYNVARATVDLIPLSTSRSIQHADKQYLISQAAGIASDAAAIALQSNKGPARATELLETGRGVLAGALQDLRTDLSTLKQHHPDLARSFIELRQQLDSSAMQDQLDNSRGTAESAEAHSRREADQRREAEEKLDRLLKDIRKQPGFNRFLLAASEAEMQQAADKGPIVILNISKHRCDAILIESSGFRHVPLSALSQSIEKPEFQTLQGLEWLWDHVVQPVLHVLGFTQPSSDGHLPRVWWIPTGPLVGSPLHAAGYHSRRNGETALDKVISSYSSSIKTIIHSRQQRDRKMLQPHASRSVVLVSMATTPGEGGLKYATAEIKAVREEVGRSTETSFAKVRAYKKDVLSALESCSIFHFAGHGGTNTDYPLLSRLLLRDWNSNPLTVESLFDTNLSSNLPYLAYLSACGTGEVKNKQLVDEGIHLTSAFQLAGFQNVIGTLWNVDDKTCVDMAKDTYKGLREVGMSNEAVSRALHRAARTLRDRWMDERFRNHSEAGKSRDGKLDEDPSQASPLWVPYVHYGV